MASNYNKWSLDLAKKIKLIVWDLDDTFWSGTLSEDDDIQRSKANEDLVIRGTQRGIISAICSKNDEKQVLDKLDTLGDVRNYFVFNSINWEPKGQRIKQLIEDMGLRDENVLFIDDNIMNLEEAKHYNPNLIIDLPTCIEFLVEHIEEIGKDDKELSRLKQYKILEEKREKRNQYSDNDSFLKESEITVEMGEVTSKNIQRIHELIMRTNQLNFTKKRISMGELEKLISNREYQCGYAKVRDKFGEYGVVGFYALNKNKHYLEHFAFSCRTMGMGIEQFVYDYLEKPEIDIVAPVSGSIDSESKQVSYISIGAVDDKGIEKTRSDASVLLKGPCDLEVMASYLLNDGDIETEFNYIDDNEQQVDFYNHTVNIINSKKLTTEQIDELSSKYSFLSASAYETNLFSREYDVVCLSILMDSTLGVYEHIKEKYKIAFGMYNRDVTQKKNWTDYINKKIMTARSNITEEELLNFSKDFVRINFGPKDIAENLITIINEIRSKKVIVVLLSELEYKGALDETMMDGKEKIHRAINEEIIKSLGKMGNVEFLDVNKYVTGQSDYFDNINHYSKLVYYNMAKEIAAFIEKTTNKAVRHKSFIRAGYENIRRVAYKVYLKIKTKR